MKKLSLTILFWCVYALVLYAQNNAIISTDSCRKSFIEQINLFPQEKVFVHTDRTTYMAGDTLCLKVYLVDAVAHFPSVYSRFVYVDLINAEGNIVKRGKIKIAKNQSCGQIEIPQTLPEGNYALRAYTTAMYGLPHDFFFKKDIFITSQTKAKKRGLAHFAGVKEENLPAENSLLSAEWENNMLKVSVSSNDAASRYLLVHTRGITHYLSEWDQSVNTLSLPKQIFPSGILQVILFDKNYNPLSEKMLLCKNDDQAYLSLRTEKKDKSLKINFLLSDSEGLPIPGNFSVSITDDKYTAIDSKTNISDYLLLTSDLKEKTEKSDTGFVSNERWKRYNIPRIIKGEMDTLPGFIELGQSVSGRVRSILRNRGIPNAQVNIISPKTMYANTTTTDKNGKFIVNGMDFPENTEFVVQAYSSKGSNYVSLLVDEDDFPAVDSIDFPAEIDSTTIEQIRQYHSTYDNIKTIELPEVHIKATKPKKPADPFSAMADISFDSKRIEELGVTCVHELLRRVVGVQVVGNNVIIRGASSIYGKSYAAIAVDGIILQSMNEDGTATSEFDLDIIDLYNVERVDIFKGSSSVIWGAQGGNGVISFTTKRGNFDYSNIENVRYNTKKIIPLGYNIPSKPSRQIHSPLIYWNPNVNTDETGRTTIEFSTPETLDNYFITIQGITDDGLIIHYCQ